MARAKKIQEVDEWTPHIEEVEAEIVYYKNDDPTFKEEEHADYLDDVSGKQAESEFLSKYSGITHSKIARDMECSFEAVDDFRGKPGTFDINLGRQAYEMCFMIMQPFRPVTRWEKDNLDRALSLIHYSWYKGIVPSLSLISMLFTSGDNYAFMRIVNDNADDRYRLCKWLFGYFDSVVTMNWNIGNFDKDGKKWTEQTREGVVTATERLNTAKQMGKLENVQQLGEEIKNMLIGE